MLEFRVTRNASGNMHNRNVNDSGDEIQDSSATRNRNHSSKSTPSYSGGSGQLLRFQSEHKKGWPYFSRLPSVKLRFCVIG